MGIPKGASPPFSLGKYRIRLHLFRLSLVLGAVLILAAQVSIKSEKPGPQAQRSTQILTSSPQSPPRVLPMSFWTSSLQELQPSFQFSWQELLASAMLSEKEQDWQGVSNCLNLILLQDPSPSLAIEMRDLAGYSFWVAVLVNDQTRKVGKEILQRAETARRVGQEIAPVEEQLVREKIVTMLETESYIEQFTISEKLATLDKAKIIQWVLHSPAPKWSPERRIRTIVFFVSLGPDALPYLKSYEGSPDPRLHNIVKLAQEKIRERVKAATQRSLKGREWRGLYHSPFILGPQFGSNEGQ